MFVAAFVALNHGCSRPGPKGSTGSLVDSKGEPLDDGSDLNDKNEDLSFDPNDPKILERLGADDGYAFAILYGADIHGSLETCG